MAREPQPIHLGGAHRRDPVIALIFIDTALLFAMPFFGPVTQPDTCTPTETKATP